MLVELVFYRAKQAQRAKYGSSENRLVCALVLEGAGATRSGIKSLNSLNGNELEK